LTPAVSTRSIGAELRHGQGRKAGKTGL